MDQKSKSRFEIIAEQIGKVVTEKNKAYGNSFEESQQFLKILYPDGVPVENYGDMLCVIRIFDKLKRIATNKDAYSESPFSDLCGYAILGIDIDNKRKNSLKPKESNDIKVKNAIKPLAKSPKVIRTRKSKIK